MNNRLMILGTNEYQNPLILRAKELGFETHTFGWKTGEIGERTADFYHPVNIMDYELLWEECKKLDPCGVVSVASELAMHPMNFLLRKMGIPCNSEKTERITTNKFLMREALTKAGIKNPKYCLVEDVLSAENISTVNTFHYPLIVKPIDLSSSRGVMKINAPGELQSAADYALDWSKIKKVIIEEFIEGQEYSGDSVAYQGKYKLLAVTEKSTTGAPHFVETGHKQPASITKEKYCEVESILYKAFEALGIEYGAIHPEFKITPEGEVLFMEIATSMGGDCIGTDLVPISTGYDYMGMIINICCGKEPSFEKICEPKEARIKYIITNDDYEEFLQICKHEPQILVRHSEIKEINNMPILKSADRAGYYITAR